MEKSFNDSFNFPERFIFAPDNQEKADLLKISVMQLKNILKVFLPFVLFFGYLNFTDGQAATVVNLDRQINWQKSESVLTEFWGAPYFPWQFDGAGYSGETVIFPVYETRIPVSSYGEVTFRIREVDWTELQSEVIPPELSADLSPEVFLVSARDEHFITVRFVPLIRGSGNIVKAVERFSLEINFQPVFTPESRNDKYTYNSVLKDGEIYKIPVSSAGIYKIDAQYLGALGIDVKNVNPSRIKIFGSGSGPLPEAVSTPRIDDLVEIPMRAFGLEDGTFDMGDRLLFFAEGPDQWQFNPAKNTWQFIKNIYDSKNYYFLKIDGAAGKRISTLPDPETSIYFSTDFDNNQVHENDRVNLLAQNDHTEGTGQSWYGENFFSVKEQDFSSSFNLSMINLSEPVHMYVEMAARNFAVSQMLATINDRVFSKNIAGVTSGVNDTYARKGFIEEWVYLSEGLKSLKIKTTASNAWLDKIVLTARSPLIFNGTPVIFSDKKSLEHSIAGFLIRKSHPDLSVWDITDPLDPVNQEYTSAGADNVGFSYAPEGLAKFIAFDPKGTYPAPEKGIKISNQNIHGITDADMIIIHYKDWKSQADQLAEHRRNFNGFKVHTVDIDHIFNEFSSGRQDPTAIRDFVKMIYDRSASLRFLLLFGDGSYDYKAIHNPVNNDNFITVYQTKESLSPTSGYVSDDYYTLLSDNEGIGLEGGMDISTGRLPARSSIQAQYLVDKIIEYETSPANNGDWVNRLVFIADDEDSSVHLDQSENIASYVENNYPVFNIDKVYMDAYNQEVNAGGHRYPEVNKALADHIFKGILAMTYIGHGGPGGFAQERILKIEDIYNWNNGKKLPLLITATCSFTGFDDPSVNSAGEATILREKGGVIGLLSTVRLVYSAANSTLMDAVYKEIFKSIDDRQYRPLGEVIRIAKNKIGDTPNKRKFLLFGDPAMSLILPKYKVYTTRINDIETGTGVFPDTLNAMSTVRIEGYIGDGEGAVMTGFNGELHTVVYDKPQEVETLQNDPGSPKRKFNVQKNVLFKGASKVNAGLFSFEFVVPQDINYKYGKGKISYYYDNLDNQDAAGYFNELVIGGSSQNHFDDSNGPEISLYMNHPGFKPGNVTNNKPVLLAFITDETGINVSGNSIGHDIKAILDDDSGKSFILNDFFQPELDNYKAGWVSFPLGLLSEGNHQIYLEAWDILNNRGTATLDFVVAKSEEQALKNIFNYPNPVTQSTRFYFEHTLPDATLEAEVSIFDLNGRHFKTIRSNSFTDGFKSEDIVWDGLDNTSLRIPQGVYVYYVKVYSRILDITVESDFSRLVVIH